MKIISSKKEWRRCLAYLWDTQADLYELGLCVLDTDPKNYTVTIGPVAEELDVFLAEFYKAMAD